MKDKISKNRVIVLLVFILISTILTSYSFYKQIPNTDTKKEILDLLNSIDPNIIQLVKEGKDEIPVLIDDLTERKLIALETHQNFHDFLSFQRTAYTTDIINGNGYAPADFIKQKHPDPNSGWYYGYYLHPQKALVE